MKKLLLALIIIALMATCAMVLVACGENDYSNNSANYNDSDYSSNSGNSQSSAHTHNAQWVTTKEATCTEAGERVSKCTTCGEVLNTEVIAAKGHTGKWSFTGWDSDLQWDTIKYATCTETGKRERTCSVCGLREEETIPMKEHDYRDATCTEAKTCKDCGATKGNALGHTCKVGQCTRCKQYFSDLQTPSLPKTISYTLASKLTTKCKITDITFEAEGRPDSNYNCMYIYLAGEKTYDAKGNSYSRSCDIGYKVYDSDGYVVKSGSAYTENLTVGEKFKKLKITLYQIGDEFVPGQTYRIELLDIG